MESKSIAEELLGNIPLLTAYKLHSLVPCLTPSDATTVEEFSNSKLAADYYVETVNITCSKYEKKIICLTNSLVSVDTTTVCTYD